jgi:hypothetical protein
MTSASPLVMVFWRLGLATRHWVQGWGSTTFACLIGALRPEGHDLIAASIYNRYSQGPSIRSIHTIWCFTMIHMIQMCSVFHWARVFVINTRPDEISEKLQQIYQKWLNQREFNSRSDSQTQCVILRRGVMRGFTVARCFYRGVLTRVCDSGGLESLEVFYLREKRVYCSQKKSNMFSLPSSSDIIWHNVFIN